MWKKILASVIIVGLFVWWLIDRRGRPPAFDDVLQGLNDRAEAKQDDINKSRKAGDSNKNEAADIRQRGKERHEQADQGKHRDVDDVADKWKRRRMRKPGGSDNT